jgi:hypothetical protein
VIAPSARGESVVESLSWAPGAGRSCRPPTRAPTNHPTGALQSRFLGGDGRHPHSTSQIGPNIRDAIPGPGPGAVPGGRNSERPWPRWSEPRAFASAMGSERVLDRALAARQALQPRSGALSLRQQPAGETDPASPVWPSPLCGLRGRGPVVARPGITRWTACSVVEAGRLPVGAKREPHALVMWSEPAAAQGRDRRVSAVLEPR